MNGVSQHMILHVFGDMPGPLSSAGCARDISFKQGERGWVMNVASDSWLHDMAARAPLRTVGVTLKVVGVCSENLKESVRCTCTYKNFPPAAALSKHTSKTLR